jgi:hypothetical protein
VLVVEAGLDEQSFVDDFAIAGDRGNRERVKLSGCTPSVWHLSYDGGSLACALERV